MLGKSISICCAAWEDEDELLSAAAVAAGTVTVLGRYLESKALGLRSRIILEAASRTASLPGLFSQDTHRQDVPQVALAAKHWQYLCLFLKIQAFRFSAITIILKLVVFLSVAILILFLNVNV